MKIHNNKIEYNFAHNKSKHIRLCKKCGGEIDNSGICNGCGNVYMSRKSIIAMAIVLFIIFVVFLLSFWESQTEKYDRLCQSVVQLNIYNEEDALIGTATGFFINDDSTILTNYHVVDMAYRLEAVTDNGQKYDLQIIYCYDDNSDLAILSCEESTGITPLNVIDADTVSIGDSIFAISATDGTQHFVAQGKISDILEINEVIVFQITAPVSDVSSGSAVFNKNGDVIGITTTAMIDGQNINLAISSNEISKLIYTEYRTVYIKDLYQQKYGYQDETTVDDGTSSQSWTDFKYEINDGLATVTGYDGDDSQLIIPNIINGCKVTAIGDEAFRSASISSVSIPDGVEIIGKQAFVDCKLLSRVSLPATLSIIDDAAFADCNALPSINLPKGLTVIGQLAFSGCSSLKNIDIPDNVASIGDLAFSDCDLLKTVTVPPQVKFLGCSVFANCQGLSNIYVDDDNKYYQDIDGVLFSADGTVLLSIPCGKGIETYRLPQAVVKIGSNAFLGCQSLHSIYFTSQLCCIEDCAFYGCSSLYSVDIPNSVTDIGEQVFRDCTDLCSVKMPDSLSVIATSTFNNCSSLSTINIPDSISSIGYAAFSGCVALKSLDLSSNINKIGGYAFENCSDLIINCVDGSVAHKYAQDNDIEYIL